MKKMLEIFISATGRISRELIELPETTTLALGEQFKYGEDANADIIRIWVREQTELDRQFLNELNGKYR